MANIPIGEAAFCGFGVIRRKPLAVLVWGLMLFVLAILPIFGGLALAGPAFETLMREITTGAEPSFESMMRLHASMMAMNPLLTVLGLVSRVLLMCAIFRAVLEPQDDRFFYVRLGKTELFVGLVFVCLVIVLVIAMMAVMGVGAAIAIAAFSASESAGVAVIIVAVLAMIGLMVWLGLRFSMALPMTFEARDFRLFESWTLTRGRVGSLFLLGLLVVVVVMLVELVMFALGGAVVIALVAARPFDEAAAIAFFSRPMGEWAAELAPWAVLVGLVISVLGAVLNTLATAPWAAAYRALAPKAPPSPAENPA